MSCIKIPQTILCIIFVFVVYAKIVILYILSLEIAQARVRVRVLPDCGDDIYLLSHRSNEMIKYTSIVLDIFILFLLLLYSYSNVIQEPFYMKCNHTRQPQKIPVGSTNSNHKMLYNIMDYLTFLYYYAVTKTKLMLL